ncbi:MAG: hypothetical protein AB1468_05120, partial [Candidatus Micrarchaeota archaeon]
SWSAGCNCSGSTGSPMSASGYNACCNVTTAWSGVNASATPVSGTQTLWCWADFVCPAAGTYERNLTSRAFAPPGRAPAPPAPALDAINTKFALFFLFFAFGRKFIRKV